MALVLVLSALALLSFLVVLILSMARTEDRASKASADIMDVRALAEMPAQIVISQIRRATSDLGTGFTWVSQPGLLRVYGTGSTENVGRPALYEAYKLYSSPQMVVAGSGFNAADEANALSNWSASPAFFTDLNAPIPLRPSRKMSGSSSGDESESPQLIYPILDPGALEQVEGFGLTGTSAPGATESQPLPMPAAWLYVLKDGTLIAPQSGSGTTAEFESDAASETNPIIGRIAFWTDDESCKINLNSASEPAPWDAPRVNSRLDRAYAEFQPARNEFHRQAGHPAFTALSPVFQSFGRDTGSGSTAVNAFSPVPEPRGIASPGSFQANDDADAERYRDYVESNHRVLPRTADPTDTANRERGSAHGTQTPAEAVTLKRERLFTTIDELLFDTSRQAQKVSGDGLQTSMTLTEADIRKSRFFLTTHSSAPETNPFNLPKISLWPVQEDENLRTRTDRLMVLASRLGGHDYHFQRKSVWNGAGDPGSSQSQNEDMGLDRNLEIIGFLQDLSGMPMPGYGGTFESKYGGRNRDQIVVSMFDLVRWGVNIENADPEEGEEFHYLPPNGSTAGGDPIGEYSAVPSILASSDGGQVRGFGRFPTLTEVAVVFVATEGGPTPGNQSIDANNNGWADRTRKLRLFLILEPFVPVPGLPSCTPAVRYRIKGLDQWKIKVKTANGDLERDLFPDFESEEKLTNRCVSTGPQEGDRVIDGMTAFNGLSSQFLNSAGAPKQPGAGDEDAQFPFVSVEVALGDQGVAENDKITFIGDTITVEILPGLGAVRDDNVVQTLRIPFPKEEAAIPVPWLATNNEEDADERIQNRFALATENGEVRQRLIQSGDVVRSVEVDPTQPWKGDLRLLAAAGAYGAAPASFPDDTEAGTQNNPSTWFFPRQDGMKQRFEAADRGSHSLRSGAYTRRQFFVPNQQDEPGVVPSAQNQTTAQTAGTLVNGLGYPDFFWPTVPRLSSSEGALNADGQPGDWDNGPGLIEDGPYLSKPDYGNIRTEKEASHATMGGYFKRGGDSLPDEESINLAPHRQISSALAFGSIPTGVYPSYSSNLPPRPWQTLLFCPNPAARTSAPDVAVQATDHVGFADPPDHAWLEFFWMPVVEPDPLSPGFSTEGKVNMNHQMMPYTWIERATALHAALRGVRITAIPSSAAKDGAAPHYKDPAGVTDQEFRYEVNATETLKGFEAERFAKGEVFRSASEICEMFLVPKRYGEPDEAGGTTQDTGRDYGGAKPTGGLTYEQMLQWWNGQGNTLDAFEATGDNTRESPYAQVYPRLCTRSNVFQVHYRVQLLRKSRATRSDVWDETKDQVAAEYRGSATVERYLDPNDRDIPDLVGNWSSGQALDEFYRYRIVDRQPFVP